MDVRNAAFACEAEPAGPQGGLYCLTVASDSWRSSEILEAWDTLVRRSENHDALYQTPQFFEHLHATDLVENLSLLTVRDAIGGLVGVVPLQMRDWALTFDVWGRVLAETKLRVVVILGSEPLVAADPVLYDRLFTYIGDEFPDCDAIGMVSVPTESLLWRHCHTSRTVQNQFLVHVPYGKRLCHTIPLPTSFDDYLAKMSKKKRYNLKRQLRLLRTFSNGSLELERIESNSDVTLLVDAINNLKCDSRTDPSVLGEDEAKKFADLADRGMLLSYILVCSERPLAVAVGMKHGATYRVRRTEHDTSIKALSPGTTMLFLLIEDVIRHQKFRRIDFGYGEPTYHHRSTNVLVERGTILLMRPTFANRMRQTGHATFHAGINALKKLLGRSRPT